MHAHTPHKHHTCVHAHCTQNTRTHVCTQRMQTHVCGCAPRVPSPSRRCRPPSSPGQATARWLPVCPGGLLEGWTDTHQLGHGQACSPAHRWSPLPSESWDAKVADRRSPSAPPPQLTHGADHVGRGSLVLRKPQGSQLGRREDDQGLGQGTEALPTYEEGIWVLGADERAGQGTEHAPGKVQHRTQDGLRDEVGSAAGRPGRPPSSAAAPPPRRPRGSAWAPPLAWGGDDTQEPCPVPERARRGV